RNRDGPGTFWKSPGRSYWGTPGRPVGPVSAPDQLTSDSKIHGPPASSSAFPTSSVCVAACGSGSRRFTCSRSVWGKTGGKGPCSVIDFKAPVTVLVADCRQRWVPRRSSFSGEELCDREMQPRGVRLQFFGGRPHATRMASPVGPLSTGYAAAAVASPDRG